jgi:hypothetical protein
VGLESGEVRKFLVWKERREEVGKIPENKVNVSGFWSKN